MRGFARAIEMAERISIFWGFIDGAAHKIGRPEVQQGLSYSGYKKTHVFNVQSVVTPDGMIASLYGPAAGIINDPAMVRQSGLEERLKLVNCYDLLWMLANYYTGLERCPRRAAPLALRGQGLHRQMGHPGCLQAQAHGARTCA